MPRTAVETAKPLRRSGRCLGGVLPPGLGEAAGSWPWAAGLLALGLLLPEMRQSQQYHAFAAAVPLGPMEDVANVLSNAAFLVAALMGARRLLRLSRRRPAGAPALLWLPWTLVVGLALTALGSTWYHLHPSNATLFWDRLPMTFTFAAIIAMVVPEELQRGGPGRALAAWAAYGVVGMAIWAHTGNLTPYLLMQIGGLALIAWRALSCRPHWFPARTVLGCYGFAKLLEYFDAEVALLTAGWIAGHPLKHLAAALAAAAILSACAARAETDRAQSRPL